MWIQPRPIGVPKKDDLELGPGTLQEAQQPLTDQPAAGPDGASMAQLATPDLQLTEQPGVLAGQQPVPTAPAPVAAPAGPRPSPLPTAEQLLEYRKQIADEIERRAQRNFQGMHITSGDTLEREDAARKLAWETARGQFSPQEALAGFRPALETAKLEQNAPVKAAQAGLATARTGVVQKDSETKTLNALARLGTMESRVKLNDALIRNVDETTRNNVMNALIKMQDLASKPGAAGAITEFRQALPTNVNDLLTSVAGLPPLPAPQVQAGREIFQRAASMFGPSANATPAPAAENPALAQARAMLGRMSGGQAQPIGSDQQFPGPPAGQPALRPIGQPEAPPTAGQNILRATAPATGGAQTVVPPGVTPPVETAKAAPKPPSPGLNKPANEAEIMKRLEQAGIADEPVRRRRAQDAAKILAQKDHPHDADWMKAYHIVNGRWPTQQEIAGGA